MNVMLVHSSDVGERQSNRRPDLVPPSVAVQMIFKFRNFLSLRGPPCPSARIW